MKDLPRHIIIDISLHLVGSKTDLLAALRSPDVGVSRCGSCGVWGHVHNWPEPNCCNHCQDKEN